MPPVRFATTRDLFQSFPTAATEIGEEGSDEESLKFVRRCVEEGKLDAAIGYCAYLLPRREAVWWSCSCMSRVVSLNAGERQCLELARDWAQKPDEARRRKALERGLESSPKQSGTWLALATGWSGGSIAPADAAPLPPSPAATAQAVRVALLSAAPRVAAQERKDIMISWVKMALAFAQEGAAFA